jgi:hypothetical protein
LVSLFDLSLEFGDYGLGHDAAWSKKWTLSPLTGAFAS